MNQREYIRNIGRIPRILFHMKRIDDADRIAGFEKELRRRKLEMQLAEHDVLLEKLLTIELEAEATPDSIKLAKMVDAAKAMDSPNDAAILNIAD